MLLLLLISGLAAVGAAAAILMRAASAGQVRVGAQLRQIETYGYLREPEEVAARRSLRSALTWLATFLGTRIAGRFGHLDLTAVRRDLLGAGIYGLTPEAFVGYQAMGAAGMLGLLGAYATGSGGGPLVAVLLLFIGTFGGWIAPRSVLSRRSRARIEQVERSLPELIDLLVVTVEAGLGFNSSLQTASRRLTGPLSAELRLTIQEQKMGLTLEEALTNMSDRCDTPSVRSFVRAVTQGETLGVSIGTMMRNLAVDTRKRRRQEAEERIQKAPVKMLFPLVFLIFPAIFIVLLGPAAFQIAETFGGS